MADIFISYAREDRARIEVLAAALMDAGYTVWWDKQIAAGVEFSKETAAELSVASVVLVAWSKASTISHWVADEAAEGRDSGRLAPISLDGALPPLGFRQFQVIDFTPWASGDPAPFGELAKAIAQKMNAPARPIAPPTAQKTARSRNMLIAGIAAACVVGVGAYALLGRDRTASVVETPSVPDRKDVYRSIAVLPFVDLSENRDQGWLADGIAEEILNVISRTGDLKVPARSSSFLFRDSKKPLSAIAMELGVEAILEGSVRRSGEQLRISAQLIDPASGFQIWSRNYDRKADDIFKVQDEISASIVSELNSKLKAAPNKGRPHTAQAYDAFLEGKYFAEQRSSESLKAARGKFADVIRMEPDFAPAYALLADAAWRSSNQDHGDVPHVEAMALAESSLAKAYALDPNLVEARAVDVGIRTMKSMESANSADELARAEQIARALIAAEPGYLPGYFEIVFNLQVQGRPIDALEFAERAVEIDPLGAMSARKLSTTLRSVGRAKEAADAAARSMAYNKESNLLVVARNTALADDGDASGALAAIIALLEAAPEDYSLRELAASSAAFLGLESEALALAPDEFNRFWAKVRLGRFAHSDLSVVDPAGDEYMDSYLRGNQYFLAREFSNAVNPLAKVSAPKTPFDAPALARLAYAFGEISGVQARALPEQDLEQLIEKMEAGGVGDVFYYEGKTLLLALNGGADALFSSTVLERYIRGANAYRAPIEFDPIFDPFKGDARLARAIALETAHKRKERSELAAEGTLDRLRAVIARIEAAKPADPKN